MRGHRGYKILIIKSDKSVQKTEAIDDNFRQNTPIYKNQILTDRQYQTLLDTLAKSSIFKLPRQRKFNSIDESEVDITIYANGQVVVSNGGTLSNIHGKLLTYLWSIN